MERLEQQTGEQENRKTPERRNSSSDDGHADMLRTLVTNRSKHPEVVPHYPSDYNLTDEESWLSKVIEREPQTGTKRRRRAQTDTDREDQDLDSDRERQRKRIKTKDDRVEAQDEFKKLHEKILDLEKNIREKSIDASSVNLEEYEQNMKEFKELGSRLKEYGSLMKQRLETVITTAEEEVPRIERAIQNKANTITSTKKTIADSSEQIDSSIQTDSEDPTLLLKTGLDLLEGDKRQLEEDLAFAQSKITENLSLLGHDKTDYNIEELKKLHSGSEGYITQLDKILSDRTKYYESIRKYVKNEQQTEPHSHQEASSSASQSKHTHHPTDQQPRQDAESEASFSEDTSQEASESDTQTKTRRGYRRMQSPDRGNKYDIPATKEAREAFSQSKGRFTQYKNGQEIERKTILTANGMRKMYIADQKSSAGWIALDDNDQPIKGKTMRTRNIDQELTEARKAIKSGNASPAQIALVKQKDSNNKEVSEARKAVRSGNASPAQIALVEQRNSRTNKHRKAVKSENAPEAQIALVKQGNSRSE